MLNETDIEKFANLSRITLSADEKHGLQSDFEAIIGYISEIENVKTQTPTRTPFLHNVMREDGEPHQTGAYSEALLAEAPRREGNYIAVKKILP